MVSYGKPSNGIPGEGFGGVVLKFPLEPPKPAWQFLQRFLRKARLGHPSGRCLSGVLRIISAAFQRLPSG
eukprot:3609500-Pyramimonas_sp.AAC.1